jgi:glycosyltransferase involved in cell wall biosynthesis
MPKDSKPRVLYIVYWGAAEPLGQSLVLPAVKRLADMGAAVTLVSFEKPTDLARTDEIARIRRSLDECDVNWIPLRYHKRPKVPATVYDCFRGIAEGIVTHLRSRPDIIHARTFVGGLIGLALAGLLRSKLIYHNEGFYPDEQVDGGVWKANSIPHRVAKGLEHQMYARADGIIAMSHRSRQTIELLPAVHRKRTPVVVVPSCVDLDHFQFKPHDQNGDDNALRLVYAGSVGGRYILDRIGRFAAVAAQKTGSVRLRILTRSDPALVASMLTAGGLSDDAWSVDSVPYTDMPGNLAVHRAGLFFLAQGLSEPGCSPTKIGEYWAMGLPVVTTPNVSDTDEIIRRERVGVIVKEHSDEAYGFAAQELRTLLEDGDLPRRCRRAAENHYALKPACERQLALYQSLIARH